VGGKNSGALRIVGVWFFGGQEKSLSSRHRRGGTCGCRYSFLKGVGYLLPTPHSVPGETLGLVRAAMLLSSLSFLEVFLGTRRFEVLGAWWKFFGGCSGYGSYLFSLIRRSWLFFSLFPFSFGLTYAEAPAVRCIVWLLY
jgi:hypothetical protein